MLQKTQKEKENILMYTMSYYIDVIQLLTIHECTAINVPQMTLAVSAGQSS